MPSRRVPAEPGLPVLPPAIARAGTAASLLAILLATLTPAGQDALVGGGFFCLSCGAAPVANLLRNILLFLPLGFFSFGVWQSLGASVLLGAALTGAVESAQMVIPGRNPLLVDLLANTTGAFLGAVAAKSLPFWLQPREPTRRGGSTRSWAFGGILAAAALVAAAPGWLLAPDPPDSALWVHWNHHVPPFGPYPGAVLEAHMGELPLEPGRVPDGYELSSRWVAGDTLVLQFESVTPHPGARGLLRIVSGPTGRELVTLVADGTALAANVPLRADEVGLTRPRHRAPRVLAGSAPGDTVRLALTVRADGGLDVQGPVQHWRGPGIDPSMGWSLLYFPGRTGPAGRAALGTVWCWLLLFIPAALADGRAAAALAPMVLVGVLGVSPLFLGHVTPLPVAGWAGGAAGWLAGRAARHWLQSRLPRDRRPGPASPAEGSGPAQVTRL